MKFSKPAKRVELVSLDANAPAVDDLLTVKVSPKVRWLSQGIEIGDAGLHPAEPLVAAFQRLGVPDFFRNFDLKSIAGDGLDGLQKVGGDGDGHDYVAGDRSGRFYVLWHGEAAFEPVAATAKEFIQWVIRERSDHLHGCPWEVYATGPVQWKYVWHKEQVDAAPLLERAREVAGWTREYVSPLGFELLSEEAGLDLRFKTEHRGHNSRFDVRWVGKAPSAEAYLTWLKRRGFGRV